MAYYDGELLKQNLGKAINEFEELNVPLSEVAIKIGQAIKNTPTADVVEVVRCNECKYKIKHTCAITGIETLFCDYGEKPVVIQPTHYCGYGERNIKNDFKRSENMDKLNSFINKIIKTNDGIKGVCIGTLAKTNELVVQKGKGGQIFYEKVENCNETQ